ncbi:MAG: hypothetical protein NXI04_13375 [Planctomycetaceae bacterium]|nr:hypothetical protein [Planctomycetaceae bacterium]
MPSFQHSLTQRLTIEQAGPPMDGKRKIMIDVPQHAEPTPDPQVDEHLERLRSRMRDTNVSREDFLAVVKQKVRDGSYLSREAAEESASRLLDEDAAKGGTYFK